MGHHVMVRDGGPGAKSNSMLPHDGDRRRPAGARPGPVLVQEERGEAAQVRGGPALRREELGPARFGLHCRSGAELLQTNFHRNEHIAPHMLHFPYHVVLVSRDHGPRPVEPRAALPWTWAS